MTTPELKIYTPAGGTRLTAVVEKGSTRDFMLMQKDEVRLRFVLAEAVTLRAGDWISVDGAGIFECTDDKQRPSFDTATGGYRYDITMQARYRKFGNRLHRFFTEATAPETKWTLTDTIEAHAQRLVKSMNALAASYPSYRPGGEQTEWHVAVDNTVDKEKCVTITYDGIDILSGIDMVAREYECEWWFDRGTLNFGICRFGTAIAMETGKELASLTRSDSSESDATRIYFQGSTRNIPSTYRHTALFHANEKSTENGTFTFRDTVRDLPNEAIHEDVRSYAFREDAKQDLIIKGKIMPGSTFEADEKGEAVEMLSTGLIGQNDLQLVTKWNPDNGGIDAGIYRLDLSSVVITLSNIVNGGNTVNGDPRFAYRVKIHGYRIHDSHTSDNLLYQYVFDGSWKTLDNRDSQGNIVLTGGVHEFHVPEYVDNGHFGRGRTADLYITIGLIADTRECAVTLRCNVNTNIDTDTKNLVNCLTPYDPYHFASELSLQFRNTKGEPIGDVVSGVTFNPDRSDIKVERKFRMPASSLPDTSSLQPGEDLCFTFEGGVDIPFIPAAYWTSDTVMRYGSEATVNGLAERRLLLPLKDEEGNPLNGYLDTRPITAEDEVREIVKTIEECYPGTETTVTAVEQTETTYTDTYEMSDGSQDKVQWKAWRFKCAMFTDENPFNPKYRLDSEKLQVTFRDIVGSDGVRHSGGALNGMTFELLYNQSANMFEIVRDSTSLLPNDAICPKAGDGMVLTGFDVRMLSDEDCDIISQAEFGLLAKARECIAEVNTDASTYEGTVMCDIAYEQYPDFESMMLTPGHRVALTDPAFGLDNFVTRVLGFSIPLDIPYDNPRYTFGEKTAYSRLGNIEDRLNGIERPTRARSGGSAAGTGLDYNRDCYISLGTSRVQVPAVIQRSDEDSGTVTVTPAEGFLPVEVSAWMVVNGSRMTNAEWRVDCDGCTATVTAPQRRPLAVGQVPPAKIKISEVTKDMAAITITATCDGMTAVETLYVDLVTESEGHLHSMLISAPVVRVSRKQDGTILSSPTKVRISTNVFDGDKLQPSQDGFLLYRTDIDTDTAWSVMTREDGVAEIAVSDFLTANDTAEAKVRRIDLRYCCPTTENIVGEGCVTITEDGGILPTFDPETGRLNFTDLDGEKLLESDIEIKDGEPGKDGKDGEDAIILDLSNEMDSVPCDADGDVLPNVAMPSTSFAVYVGTREDTGWTFAKTESGCTSIISGSDLVLTSITADRATVTLTATKDGKARVAVFTVTKVKAGQQGGKGDAAVIYRLHPSADKAGVAADNTVDPASVYVIVAKTVGNEQRETPVSYGTVMYRIDNGTETTLAWADTGRTQSVAIPATARALTFLLYDTDGATLLDSERIPVIRDGEDGSSVTIVSTSVHYATSTSGTVAPTSGWSVNMPALQLGKYLWTRRIVAYSDGTSTTDYSASHLGRNFEYGDFTAAQLDTLQQGVKTKIDNADFRADLKTRLKTDSDFLAATKGDKGDTGAQGEKGLKGDTGPKGDKGDKPNVTLGSDGYLTIDGIKQAKCLVGPQGIQGVQGIQGLRGETGPKGDTGETGETGASGPTGPTGPQGENGYSTIINADGTITQTKNPTTAQLTQTKTKLEAIRDTANNAASKADTAATNADSALTAANTAKTTANTALTTAQGKASMADVRAEGYSKFSGNYADLSGKPTIPTKMSQLANDGGYQTAAQVDSIVSGKGFAMASSVSNLQSVVDEKATVQDVRTTLFSGTDGQGDAITINDLKFVYRNGGYELQFCTQKNENPMLGFCTFLDYAHTNHTHDQYLTTAILDSYAKKTDIPSLSGYATQSWVQNQHYATDQTLLDYAKKSDISGLVHNDDFIDYKVEVADWLSDKADKSWVTSNYQPKGNYLTSHQAIHTLTIQGGKFGVKTIYNPKSAASTISIPTHTSHLTNDSGFLTSHQSLANYVTALGTSGNYLTWTKNGAVNNITVPYASYTNILNGTYSTSVTDQSGDRNARLYVNVLNGTTGLFPANNNANAILTISRHSGNFYSQLGFSSNGNIYFRCFNGVALDTTTSWKLILDNANYSSILDGRYYTESEINTKLSAYLTTGTAAQVYVRKSGDTMTGRLNLGSSTAHVFADGTCGAWLQYGSHYLNVKSDGLWHNNAYKIWDSGNDGSGSGLDADLLDGYHNGEVDAARITHQYLGNSANLNSFLTNGRYSTSSTGDCSSLVNQPSGMVHGEAFLKVVKYGNYGYQFLAAKATDILQYWTRVYNNGTWGGWSRLAFTTDNVASATRLQGTYSLWGQSFYGNNVSGKMCLSTNDSSTNFDEGIRINSAFANPLIHFGGSGTAGTGANQWTIGLHDNKSYFALTYNSWSNVILSSTTNGNVGIGTTSPSYKLDVAGDILARGWLRTTGGSGWYSHTYGGGWYMEDTIWVRTFNNKSVYTGSGTIRTDGELHVGNSGSKFKVSSSGSVSGISFTSNNYFFDRKGYAGDSWGHGYGAFATEIADNSAQTPLMVAYRAGSNPSAGGANRLFSLELLNTGSQLNFTFGQTTVPLIMYSDGHSVFNGNVTATSFVKSGSSDSYVLLGGGGVKALSTIALKTDIPSLSGYATQSWVNSQGFIKNGVAESHLASIYFHQTDEINRFGGALYLQHRGGGLSGYGSTGNVYICANGGNVGIGTTNPSYKVHVKGEFYVEGGQVRAGVAKVGGDNTYGAWLQYGSNYINVKDNGPWWNNTSAIWHSGMTSLSFGNYTIRRDSSYINIGTASGGGADGISVEQSGDVVVHGWLTTDGFTNNSDIRLKDLREDLTLDIRDIANAPSKVFVWKRNGRLDAGSVAQYWMGLHPLLAHEGRNGMLGMDYGKNALISVVAVAKKVVSHEERIEALERENAELRERVRVPENV